MSLKYAQKQSINQLSFNNNIAALLNQVKGMEELHKKGFKTKEEILLIQSAIDDSYTAILKLQYALKNKKN